jgi:N-acetylglucosaminyldiphosphoundecaprenol N-acetyl-beta-D-mannosaminyltransferase
MNNKVIDKYIIGHVNVSCITLDETIQQIKYYVNQNISGYICVSNMRTVTYGNLHNDYSIILNKSLLNLPDGMPLVWCARLWGFKNVMRTTGPDLFTRMLCETNSCISYYLLGDTEDTLNLLTMKYNIEKCNHIVGSYSPPFCDIKDFDYKGIAEKINKTSADIIWIALQSPKQDYFTVNLLPLLKKGIIINVGAAFRFALGEYKHPPKFFQKIGFTGFFWRFRRHPLSETIWYIKHIIFLLYFMIQIILRKLNERKY